MRMEKISTTMDIRIAVSKAIISALDDIRWRRSFSKISAKNRDIASYDLANSLCIEITLSRCKVDVVAPQNILKIFNAVN